jgi:hypothetical protein
VTPPDGENGHWPKWRAKFANDFRSTTSAKSNDGLRAPSITDPDWANSPGADTATLLDAARRRHDQAEARIEKAEARAARLVQVALSLLAIAFVVTGYGANRLRDIHAPVLVWMLCAAVSAATLICLALALIQGVGVDRVGFVQPASPSEAADFPTAEAQRRNLSVQEYKAAKMANWTARAKVNEFLQARAWLTRGVTGLVICGACAAALWATTSPTDSSPIPPTTTTAVPTSTAPGSVPPGSSTTLPPASTTTVVLSSSTQPTVQTSTP